MNKIGPYRNPSETYDFYSLPFCHPPKSLIQHRHSSLGEDLEGDSISPSLYDIRFRVDALWNPLCRVHLNEEEIGHFQKAIEQYYFFEWIFDGLPLRGFVGIPDFPVAWWDRETPESSLPFAGLPEHEVGRLALAQLPQRTLEEAEGVRHFLFRHLHFSIYYNEDQVVAANITADLTQLQLLRGSDLTFEFSYSVSWHESQIEFAERLNVANSDDPNLSTELQIRWLGILNSSILVVLLTGFVSVILMRILKSDYTRYRKRETMEVDEAEPDDYGWKLVHGDVFRFPDFKLLFCSLLGVGTQFFFLLIFSLLLASTGIVSPSDPGGSAYTAAVLLYSLTSVIAGLVSSYFYSQMEGAKWAWCVVVTSLLFTLPCFVLGLFLNIVASAYEATGALSLSAVLLIVTLWLFIGFPLTLVGSIAGRHLASPFEAPTRTNHHARAIPAAPWYRRSPVVMLFAGLLPFSAIYIELYFIYYSVWGHHHYTLFGLLFLVFIILVTVTACVTISLTYFQLAMEDHKWWWRAFFNGASAGLFIYGYSIYYFFSSQMTGFLQASFFFIRMFLLSYVFWIMLGTVGVLASLKFIKQIYSNIKFA